MPPVLACFSDQDARVRYYACESMYNIAKVAKGEILLFFNEIFDALAKVRDIVTFRWGIAHANMNYSSPPIPNYRSRMARSFWIAW